MCAVCTSAHRCVDVLPPSGLTLTGLRGQDVVKGEATPEAHYTLQLSYIPADVEPRPEVQRGDCSRGHASTDLAAAT